MKRLFLLFVIISHVCIASVSIADIHNPKPYSGDLILPMPNGASMAFRPVFIGEGDQPFALKEFKLGDRAAGGFKEYPTDVVIGGAFIKSSPSGQQEWLYYIGKYEVNEAQYYSIMEPGKSDEQKPITKISWFDAQEFIKKYNIWLFKNAKDKLPKNEDSFGYLRLPTEVEWEFAARGGSEVDTTHFDRKHPYPGQLSKYEWFAGPSSSHGKIKKIGILEPNDLKIHDMLGNVSEMTHSFYRIEYYQGRTGGFVSRGGSCFTSKKKIRSSLREEIPFYKLISGNISPTRQPTLGLRLVISSQIYASRKTSGRLATAWEDYVKTRPTPVARPIYKALPLATRTNVQLADALESLKRLVDELNNMSDVSQTALEQVGLLNASFKNIESTVKKAEYDSAFAWVKIASETAYIVYSREMKELPGKRKALKIATNMGKTRLIDSLTEQIRSKEQNIKGGLESYGFAFMQLEKIRESSVNKGFERYKNFLVRRSASDQIRLTGLVKKHYQKYFRNRRLNMEKWKTDLENF